MNQRPRNEAPFWGHVEELRRTAIGVFLVLVVGFCGCLTCYEPLIKVILRPLEHLSQEQDHICKQPLESYRITNNSVSKKYVPLPQQCTILGESNGVQIVSGNIRLSPGAYIELSAPAKPRLVLLGPMEGMLTTFKISFWSALALTAPFWLLLITRFIAPGLKGVERTLVPSFLAITLIALAVGIYTGIKGSIPFANKYLYGFNQSIGENFWSASVYLQYTILLLVANVLAMQFAVILGFAVHLRWISETTMVCYRRVVIVGIFVAAAVLTPPDVVTQVIMALPLVILYEVAIFYARVREKTRYTEAVRAS